MQNSSYVAEKLHLSTSHEEKNSRVYRIYFIFEILPENRKTYIL